MQYAFWIKTKRSGGVTKSFHGSQDHAREHAPDCIRMRWDESSNSGPKAERIIVSDGETCPFCSTSTSEDVHSSKSWTCITLALTATAAACCKDVVADVERVVKLSCESSIGHISFRVNKKIVWPIFRTLSVAEYMCLKVSRV